MWAALHVVKASVSMAGGSWSDRVGRRTVIATGWLVYAAVYAGFAVSEPAGALRVVPVVRLLFRFRRGHRESAGRRPGAGGSARLRVRRLQRGAGPRRLAASVVFGLMWKCVRRRGGVRPRRRAGAPRDRAAVCRGPSEPACYNSNSMPRILVTNDDGYRSKGFTRWPKRCVRSATSPSSRRSKRRARSATR